MNNDVIIRMANKLIEIEKNNPIEFAYIQGRVDSLIEKNTEKGTNIDFKSVTFESR